MAEITRSGHDVTIDEYLELEKASPVRHEFVGGRLYAMTGTTKRHNLIAGKIARKLADAAEDTPCQEYMSQVKVRTPNDRGYYPDVMVSCEPGSGDDYIEEAPCLIVEVTSSSTATTDRREKRMAYLQIPSLRGYLIVDQENRRVEHHIGQYLPGANLTLSEIYAVL